MKKEIEIFEQLANTQKLSVVREIREVTGKTRECVKHWFAGKSYPGKLDYSALQSIIAKFSINEK